MKQDDGFEGMAENIVFNYNEYQSEENSQSLEFHIANALRQVSKEAYEKASKELRASFVKFLTVDSDHSDKRKKDYNQAIFMKSDEEYFDGKQVFNGTDLYMVLEKFDKAVNEFKKDGDE